MSGDLESSSEHTSPRGNIKGMTDNEKAQAAEAAKARLAKLATERKKTEKKLADLQEESRQAVIDVLTSRTLGPSDTARAIGYDRQHVGRIARDAKIPTLRPATVGKLRTKPAEEPPADA